MKNPVSRTNNVEIWIQAGSYHNGDPIPDLEGNIIWDPDCLGSGSVTLPLVWNLNKQNRKVRGKERHDYLTQFANFQISFESNLIGAESEAGQTSDSHTL